MRKKRTIAIDVFLIASATYIIFTTEAGQELLKELAAYVKVLKEKELKKDVSEG